MISRRKFGTGILAVAATLQPQTLLSADFCATTRLDFRPVANEGFNRWFAAFQSRAARRGIKRSTIVEGFKGGGFLPTVVSRDRNQFQKRRTLEDYIAIATSEARLKVGRRKVSQHQDLLRAIESKYGVDPFVVAAIWGVESRYGERRGDVPVISATATLAFDGRRADLFEKQLIAALKILQRGEVRADRLLGSWAGAMGHTQFIPTSYLSFAVDFDQNGRRDVWSDDPTDALASTAAYLARNGWVRGRSWGGEVGVTSVQGSVIRPQAGGPRFVVSKNHRVIRRYNNSAAYAITVGHLADRLRGAGPLQGRFPNDGFGMSKQDRVELQNALVRKRYDIGDVDGVIGPKTQCAIQSFQRRNRLVVDGQPSLQFVQRLTR